jgi:hypothetical protein
VSVLQSSSLVPLHSEGGFHSPGGNLWAPPLPFRRRPPQSNYPPATVPVLVHRLGPRLRQAGISRMAPPRLAPQLLSLPAMLHKPSPNAIASCSQAPRGLFVLLRVTRIFTRTSISPGPSLRQCSSRYTIRAGRNLPDKEFRYLRTVIVTAAVHRGFGSERRATEVALTPPLNLPALGRCQPLYIPLRVGRDLCFC